MFNVTWGCSVVECSTSKVVQDPITTDVSMVDVTMALPIGWVMLPDAISGGMKLFCEKCAKGLDPKMVEKAKRMAKKRRLKSIQEELDEDEEEKPDGKSK